MRLKKKIICMTVALAMVVTMAIPATVCADTTWTQPTEPMKVDNSIVKIGVHAAASTIAIFLGGNLVAERASDYKSITSASGAEAQNEAAKAFVKLGVVGTSINANPDPYLWNYFYNKGAAVNGGTVVDDEVYLSTVGSPMANDTTIVSALGTSYTLARRPEITMDTKGGYDSLIAQLPENTDNDASNDYDPIQMTYQSNDLNSFVYDMYNLSDAIVKSGKKGRYDTASYNTNDIAQKYEAYMKGLQLYIMQEIEKGTVEKRTVAIIDPTGIDTNNDGIADKYKCYTSANSSGTAASCREAAYCESTTNNIINTENLTVESDGFAYATPAQLCKADAIMTGVQAQISVTEESLKSALLAADSTLDVPPIRAVDPQDVFTIRANSVECLAGIPLCQGFIYPELVNPVYGVMYVYKNFWHVQDQSTLVSLANANFANASLPESIKADGQGFSEADIQSKVDQGLKYYESNRSEFRGTKLELSDMLGDVGGYLDKYNVSKATVSAISNKAYTGKAITPALTIKAAGKTLTKGKDYEVAYSNNVNPGKATVVITGIGGYTGTKTVTFKIAPKQGAISKLANLSGKKLKVTWKKDTKATGYQVLAATNSKMTKNKKSVTATSYKTVTKTIKKVKKGSTYYVKVRAYKKIDGKNVYGSWSKAKKVKIRR